MPTDLTTDTEDITTATGGHFQIVVPNFGSAAPAGSPVGTLPSPLSSFIRLGKAATTAEGGETEPASTHGPTLLGVALASSPIAAGNLVYDEVVEGDKNAVFADDIRDQGADNNANGLSPAARVAESAKLLTKGGWRDHTDGNRITTTYGDKVEVIRGNLKLIVMGRQDVAGSGAIWDSSGGMIQDNDAAPGQVTEIKWVESQGGTWRAVETTTKGDVDSTFDGKVVERFVGGSVATIVGREDKATQAVAITGAERAKIHLEYLDAKKNKYLDAGLSEANYLKQRGYYADQGYSYADPLTPAEASNPFVYEQTWASRIESYTGSEATPVPDILETTFANNITETTGSATKPVSAINVTTFADNITETTGSVAKPASAIKETVYSGSITSELTATGTIKETMTANLVDRKFVGNVHELNMGGKWETVLGGWGAFRVGASLELFLGAGAEVNLGPAMEINVGLSLALATMSVEATKTELELKDLKITQAGLGLATFGFYIGT